MEIGVCCAGNDKKTKQKQQQKTLSKNLKCFREGLNKGFVKVT